MTKHKIYILVSKTHTILSKIISAATNTFYTHVSLSFDEHFNDMVTFSRKYINFPFPGGFVRESIYDGIFLKEEYVKCIVYSMEIDDETFIKIKQVVNNIESNPKKYRYNYLGAICAWLHKDVKFNNKFFCSQFVSSILMMCGVELPKRPLQMLPNDFTSLPLKVEHKGSISGLRYSLSKIAS